MTAQHHQGQSPEAALVLLVAGCLVISGHRPQGLAQLQAVLLDWAVATGTEVLEAVARTQGRCHVIPGFLFDIAALPRFVLGALPWWTALIAASGLWFIAGGIRAAARLSLALTAITIGTFLAATAWLADHPTITSGEPETIEIVGGVE